MEPAHKSILASPALGTGLEALAIKCSSPLRPMDPGRIVGRKTIAVTFSGGGFRATLAALGVVRFLADSGRLGDVRFVSSVSGGSVANGMLACQWGELRQAGFTTEAVERLVIEPIVRSISKSSMRDEILLNLWRVLGGKTTTQLLARALDRRFFLGKALESLDPACRFVINAANLITGVRFAFERDVLGDYVMGLAPTAKTGITVATAVSASAAVPGALSPVPIRGIRFPCPESGDPLLVDGGSYDNTGIQALDHDQYRDLFLISMNAGGVFVTGRWGGVPIIRNLARSSSLLYHQSTGLRTRWMVERFQARETATQAGQAVPAWGRDGVLIALASTMLGPNVQAWRDRYEEVRTWNGRDLAFVPTVFDRLERRLCRHLIYRGWWLTGAALAKYHPGSFALPSKAPPLG